MTIQCSQQGTIPRDIMREGPAEIVNLESIGEKSSRWHHSLDEDKCVWSSTQVTTRRRWKSRAVFSPKLHPRYLWYLCLSCKKKISGGLQFVLFFGILYRPPVSWVPLGQCSCSLYIIHETQFALKKLALSLMKWLNTLVPFCVCVSVTLNNSRILLGWKTIDQMFENTWLVSLTRWLRLYFFMLSFICLWNLNMPRLDKEILDCIYLRLSKIMLDRTAYLLTGGRNAVNCSEDNLDSEWQTKCCYWLRKGCFLSY